MATYLVYYGNHIEKEEEVVLPRAAQFLSPQDWAAVKAVPVGRADPLFGEQPAPHYRALRERISAQSH